MQLTQTKNGGTLKKVDGSIITLIENGVKTHHRSMFVIAGNNSHDQIMNLKYILTKSDIKSKPKVLWCYEDNLDISSHKQKQIKQVKKLERKGNLDPDKTPSLLHFINTVEYCRYKDSERILGDTYGMCILQDFEALTPNILATTIETVEGGGLVILLIRSLSLLTRLCTMVMDVHERLRAESSTGRFNDRLLLSLASCRSCMFLDDKLNVLSISSHVKSISPVAVQTDTEGLSKSQRELKDFKDQSSDDFPHGPLIKMCCTLNQAEAVITLLHAIFDKAPHSTLALLGGRGRGKSAALGLAVAGAVAAGYSNIFVTAPCPENLKTFFDFVLKGFDMLEYKEHLHYDIVKSSIPELKKVTIRINIYKQHRQTIEYIQPHKHGKLSNVELLVIDEAAAIPLPIVKSLLGPYLVFLSFTVNGYESTGRSLSFKLMQELEKQNQASSKSTDVVPSGQSFKRIYLSRAIRFASGDPVESWLDKLLCLDIENSIPKIGRLSPPSECALYYVNRDVLFSCHKDSELFLQRIMALFGASHYKSSPNDLQLLADHPAHHLFVLLGPVDKSRKQFPDIFCVVQVCLEGSITKDSAIKSLKAGHQQSGDEIPWKFCEQFQNFPGLSGARIVRIATHPEAMKLRYGSAAIELLTRYFEGQFAPISELNVQNDPEVPRPRIIEAAKKVSLLKERIKPRLDLPPFLFHLHERPHEKLHYLGVSFGLTLDLFRFWKNLKFAPFYICEVPNSVTGEQTCMMLKPLHTDDIEVKGSDELGFLGPHYRAFRAAFMRRLCSPKFNTMECELVWSILAPKLDFTDADPSLTISNGIYDDFITCPFSMGRLKDYVTNRQGDPDLISDLKLPLAYLYFQEKLPVKLSKIQASVLICMGLQNQDVSYTERVMKLEIQPCFMKVMKKFYKHLDSVSTKQFTATLPTVKEMDLRPHEISVDEDLDEAANKVKDDYKAKGECLLNPAFLQGYAIADKDEFESAIQNSRGQLPPSGVISVKSSKSKHGRPKDKGDKKRTNDRSSSNSSKKKRTS